MKRAPKKKSSIYQAIAPVLEHGSEEDIARVRKEYYRKYRADFRKQKRARGKEVLTFWEFEDLQELTEIAQKHKMSIPKFIKNATLASMTGKSAYVVPNFSEIRQIAQLLAMSYNSIQDLSEGGLLPTEIGKVVLQKITLLEREILPLLHYPKLIQECLKNMVQENPKRKAEFLELLAHL